LLQHDSLIHVFLFILCIKKLFVLWPSHVVCNPEDGKDITYTKLGAPITKVVLISFNISFIFSIYFQSAFFNDC
jgi:hypothetical protein